MKLSAAALWMPGTIPSNAWFYKKSIVHSFLAELCKDLQDFLLFERFRGQQKTPTCLLRYCDGLFAYKWKVEGCVRRK